MRKRAIVAMIINRNMMMRMMMVTYNWRRRGCGDLKEYICILHTHFCIQSTNFDSRSSPLWILPDLDAGRRAHGLLVGQAGFS
jgi:hypothetical protein